MSVTVAPSLAQEPSNGPNGPNGIAALLRLAEGGNVQAQTTLAQRLMKGHGVPFDYDGGMAWLQRAANAGEKSAQHLLASIYDYGRLCDRDLDKAVYWYERVAAVGEENAKKQLEHLHGADTSSLARIAGKSLKCEAMPSRSLGVGVEQVVTAVLRHGLRSRDGKQTFSQKHFVELTSNLGERVDAASFGPFAVFVISYRGRPHTIVMRAAVANAVPPQTETMFAMMADVAAITLPNPDLAQAWVRQALSKSFAAAPRPVEKDWNGIYIFASALPPDLVLLSLTTDVVFDPTTFSHRRTFAKKNN